MITAVRQDKDLVVDILSKSFDGNQSVNYIIKQDARRADRIRNLISYSFDVCFLSGRVYLSENKSACALVLFPDKKETTFQSVFLDLKFIANSIGLSDVRKTLKRESLIKEIQPKIPMYYLWFIGVHPDRQNEGTGTKLLRELIDDSKSEDRTIVLETSALKNLPWYQKNGFEIYNTLDLGYKLHFLKEISL